MRLAGCSPKLKELVDAFGLLTVASDGSTDSGVQFGEAFAFSLATVLDAISAIMNGVGDLIRLLAWVNESVLTFFDNVNASVLEAFLSTRDAIVGFFDLDLSEQGRAMLQSFIDGFMSMHGPLVDAISGCAFRSRDWLPFSDAKKGPLSDLTASGAAFLNTFREGFAPAEQQLQDRVGAIAGDLQATLGMPDVQVSNAPALAPDVQVHAHVIAPTPNVQVNNAACADS